MQRRLVKDCHSAAVLYQCVCRGDAIPRRPAGVDPIRQFRFLEYPQVHVGLLHPPQCRLQSTVTSVTDVIGAESNPHCPTCRLSRMFANPRPTGSVSPLSPLPSPLSPASSFAVPFLLPPPPASSLRSCLSSRLHSPLFPPPCRSPRNGYPVVPLKPEQVALCRGCRGCYPRYQLTCLLILLKDLLI